MSVSTLEIARRQLTRTTHHLHSLPIVTLMPHSRCNCRCVMCDIWLANRNGLELTADDLAPHLDALRSLHVQWVVLSGGEALMHRNLWALCAKLRDLGVKITLLSTGLLLGRHAGAVVQWCDEVIVSLDGSPQVHDAIRNVPRAYGRLAQGVQAIKNVKPDFPVHARCVIQRLNYFDLPQIVASARDLQLDSISFLAADVSSTAFNRPDGWTAERTAGVALNQEEVTAFAEIIEEVIEHEPAAFETGFIAESPDKLRRLAQYFDALQGRGTLPEISCNAPWVSAVIETDGAVRPCFFHPAQGNIHETPLDQILNSETAIQFRRRLDVTRDPICRKCTCTLNFGRRQDVFR